MSAVAALMLSTWFPGAGFSSSPLQAAAARRRPAQSPTRNVRVT
jgi:hypothetical protein